MQRRAFLLAACTLAASSARAQTGEDAPRFTAAIAYSAERGGVSFLVARNGVVLGEDYPDGDPDARWPIGAGTRMFAPLLAASLADDGLMNLDEPVAMTLGDWGAHPQKSSITIRALLNGTSGIAFGRRGPGGVADAIALEPSAAIGERYIDDPAPFMIVAEIARRKLDAAGRAADPALYLTQRTLTPIGCVPIAWTRDPDGAARFHDGVGVSARGWAQVGELVRREGVWRAGQLVDGGALREACQGSFADARAGMGLWLNARARGDAPYDSDLWRMNPAAPEDLVMAAGAGGQRLYIIPSARLVIVRQGRDADARAWSDAAFLSRVSADL